MTIISSERVSWLRIVRKALVRARGCVGVSPSSSLWKMVCLHNKAISPRSEFARLPPLTCVADADSQVMYLSNNSPK